MLETWIELKDKLDHLVIFMQKKFKNRFLFRFTQEFMVKFHWERSLREFSKAAKKKKNDHAIELCKKLSEIDEGIKMYVCKKFIGQI